MKARTAVIDRIEEGIATVIPDDGTLPFSCPASEDLYEGQAVVITDEGVRPAKDGERPSKNTKKKLRDLFNKSKRSN